MGWRGAVRRRRRRHRRCSQGSTIAARELDRLCGPVATATTGAARTEGADDRGRAGRDRQMTTARVTGARVLYRRKRESVAARAGANVPAFARHRETRTSGDSSLFGTRFFSSNTAMKKIHNTVHDGRVRA